MKAALTDHGMTSLYPPRLIDSVYLDNDEWSMFHESNEGVMPRKKHRIRSYPGTESIRFFETKISSFEGRYKVSNPISGDDLRRIFKNGRYLSGYGRCLPRIIVRYWRSYHQFENLRITLDSGIQYAKCLRLSKNKFGSHFSEPECVMEIKFNIDETCEKIFSILNITAGRFSKYERAVKSVAHET